MKDMPVVALLVSKDVTYEGEQPLTVLPVVLTSGGFQVRHADGRPYSNAHCPDWDDKRDPRYRLSTEEKVLAVVPLPAGLTIPAPEESAR